MKSQQKQELLLLVWLNLKISCFTHISHVMVKINLFQTNHLSIPVIFLPCSSVSSCSVESLTSPPPPRLCSDGPPQCCGRPLLVCGIYSDFLFPAQSTVHISNGRRWHILHMHFTCRTCSQTLCKADTCSWRLSHFLPDSSAKALCFSICVCWMPVVFCSLARSSSISFIFALSLAFSSSCNNRHNVIYEQCLQYLILKSSIRNTDSKTIMQPPVFYILVC